VRELENCVRRTATLTGGACIHATDFACSKDECLSATLWTGPNQPPPGFVPLPIGRTPRPSDPPAIRRDESELPPGLDERSERERIINAMEEAGWVQAKAARLLGVTPRQIGYALRKHDIPIKKF